MTIVFWLVSYTIKLRAGIDIQGDWKVTPDKVALDQMMILTLTLLGFN